MRKMSSRQQMLKRNFLFSEKQAEECFAITMNFPTLRIELNDNVEFDDVGKNEEKFLSLARENPSSLINSIKHGKSLNVFYYFIEEKIMVFSFIRQGEGFKFEVNDH